MTSAIPLTEPTAPQRDEAAFTVGEHDFLLHGRPHQILSGAVHYFRVHPDQWSDRIAKARAMGLNTIETYVAWNFHAPEPGRFDTDGPRDLVEFLELVQLAGMHAIVRPGPYICAEWDGGGLPGWLFDEPGMRLRSSDPAYLRHVTDYLDRLLPLLAPLQIDRGGPVVLLQVENEYGAYGADAEYLRRLVGIFRGHGITVPLTTVDQPTDEMLANGTLPDLLTTGSFGSRAAERLAVLRRHQPTGPLMCSEFWDGWFDHWGEHHHTTAADAAAAELEVLLAAGASVNIYMFHGGTNFGFGNGANHKGVYKSHVTSYDYDAPLSESGEPTAKYEAFRAVLARHAAGRPTPTPAPRAAASPAPTPAARFTAAADLAAVRDRLGEWRSTPEPVAMDAVRQYRGFCVYRTALHGRGGVLAVESVRDRAQVAVDGVQVGVLERDRHDRALVVPAGEVLELLVEDRGRVDYGPRLGEPKGLIGAVALDGAPLTNWQMLPLSLDRLPADLFDGAGQFGAALAGPAFARARFDLDAPADLFLDTAGFGKGLAWVNGFLLGRYWTRGPQRTLYVPAPVTAAGSNELVVLELTALRGPTAAFAPRPLLGHREE